MLVVIFMDRTQGGPWGLCDPGAVCVAPAPEGCSLGLQKGEAWPGDSQWTGRGQGPRASWGPPRDFLTTSIVSQGHICQIEMPLGGLEGQGHTAGAG